MSNYYLFIILFIDLILNKRENKRNFVKKKLFFSWPTKKLIKIYKLWFKLYMYK